MTKATFDDAQIRETVYLFWLDDGQPDGREEEHWWRAVDALNTLVSIAKDYGQGSRRTGLFVI